MPFILLHNNDMEEFVTDNPVYAAYPEDRWQRGKVINKGYFMADDVREVSKKDCAEKRLPKTSKWQTVEGPYDKLIVLARGWDHADTAMQPEAIIGIIDQMDHQKLSDRERRKVAKAWARLYRKHIPREAFGKEDIEQMAGAVYHATEHFLTESCAWKQTPSGIAFRSIIGNERSRDWRLGPLFDSAVRTVDYCEHSHCAPIVIGHFSGEKMDGTRIKGKLFQKACI